MTPVCVLCVQGVGVHVKLSGKLKAPPGEMLCPTLCLFSPQWNEGLMKPCWWKNALCSGYAQTDSSKWQSLGSDPRAHTLSSHIPFKLAAGAEQSCWAQPTAVCLHIVIHLMPTRSLRSIRFISPFTRWASGGTERWNHKPTGSEPGFTLRQSDAWTPKHYARPNFKVM